MGFDGKGGFDGIFGGGGFICIFVIIIIFCCLCGRDGFI